MNPGRDALPQLLLERDVLPSGVVPLIAVATTAVHDPLEHLQARLADDTRSRHELRVLPELVTERGNPANRRGVADVVVHLPAALLDGGVEIVDPPGVGSVYTHNTDEASQAFTRMDVAVFVLTADPPISASERALLRAVRAEAVTVFCGLNKIDRPSADELAEARTFTERVLAEELGEAPTVWPVSARAALVKAAPTVDADQEGAVRFDAFSAALRSYLAAAAAADLIRSVATRGERLARAVAETQAGTLGALSVSEDELGRRLDTFTVQLTSVRRDREKTQAVAAGELRRLLAETNEQADAVRRDNELVLLRGVAEHFEQAGGSTREAEQSALHQAAADIQTVVDGWRLRRAKELDAAIPELDQRVSERLSGHIAAAREAASSLFDLALPAAPTPVGLTGATRFSYRFSADPGQVDALPATIRHRMPGGIARRQVRRYVLDRAASLLDRHIGRARADFQDRLAETGRRLAAELNRRFEEAVGRLADAATAATSAAASG